MAILESVMLTNDIWYRYNDTKTDGMMFNNAIFVLFKRGPQNGSTRENQNHNILSIEKPYPLCWGNRAQPHIS